MTEPSALTAAQSSVPLVPGPLLRFQREGALFLFLALVASPVWLVLPELVSTAGADSLAAVFVAGLLAYPTTYLASIPLYRLSMRRGYRLATHLAASLPLAHFAAVCACGAWLWGW